ncbi:YeeE/YedE family protein [Thermotoga profunda]|uniref:YeeE/YedE family protein n=1 Tax=Thermotoga profunda TaxID=1508420 RepID=UPI000597CE52|nr:YeeE/YedE family protein [Thermotoga profunda]
MIWTGLVIGIIFGIILQKGRVCFNSAFRDVLIFKDNYLMKLAAFTLALESITLLLFAQLGVISLAPKPLNWIANIIGGYIFGIGMVLAGGCASGVTYRSGEGMTTAWFAAIFYGLTAYATNSGIFSGWTKWVNKYNITVQNTNQVYASKTGPTLSTVFNVNPWVVTLIFAGLLIWYAFGTKTTQRPTKLNWVLASVLIAILAPIAWWTSAKTGRNYGLGITGGWVNLFSVYTANKPINWEGAEIIGIILGALISSLASKEFKLRMPKDPKTYLQVMIGGALMGFGAATASGCNIGHFLTGVPQLAISSIIASIFFILGNWTMAWLLFGRER